MKRGGPLKRTALQRGDKPLERRTPLLPGDGGLSRGEGLRRTSGPKAKPKPTLPKDEQQMAEDFYAAVCPPGVKCKVCGKGRLDKKTGEVRKMDAHHVVPKRLLKRLAQERGVRPAFFVYDPGIGMPLCRDCHFAHEYPGVNPRRVRLHEVPYEAAWRAVEWGFGYYLERTYLALP